MKSEQQNFLAGMLAAVLAPIDGEPGHWAQAIIAEMNRQENQHIFAIRGALRAAFKDEFNGAGDYLRSYGADCLVCKDSETELGKIIGKITGVPVYSYDDCFKVTNDMGDRENMEGIKMLYFATEFSWDCAERKAVAEKNGAKLSGQYGLIGTEDCRRQLNCLITEQQLSQAKKILKNESVRKLM